MHVLRMCFLKAPYSFLHLSVGRHYCSRGYGYHDSNPLQSGNPFVHLKYCRIDIVYVGKRETVMDQDSNLAKIVSQFQASLLTIEHTLIRLTFLFFQMLITKSFQCKITCAQTIFFHFFTMRIVTLRKGNLW